MTSSLPVFQIRDLNCQYVVGRTVLSIKNLDIDRGALVFILGASGIGKSTFIETLGLMNQTIADSDNTSIQFRPTNEKLFALQDAWQQSDKQRATFRNDYFSFIFQNTNLMPNFTAGENMCISSLLKGQSMAVVKPKVLAIMERLGLPASIFDMSVNELSGGQRQRTAVIEQILCSGHYMVLDEPFSGLDVGNIEDVKNAFNLITSTHEFNTIIYSTHDIELAVELADSIYVIGYPTIDGKKADYGTIVKHIDMKELNLAWKDFGLDHIEVVKQIKAAMLNS